MGTPHSSEALLKSPVVPLNQFAGKWIAWDRERQHILASGQTLAEVVKAVAGVSESEPVFEKIPRADRFLGAAR